MGTLVELDVWVDDDDVVRRIDIETSDSGAAVLVPGESGGSDQWALVTGASVQFLDIGVPNTIEAPATFCEATDDAC